MKNTNEKEKQQRFQQAEEGYTAEREDVPIPDERTFMETGERSIRPASNNRPSRSTPLKGPASSKPESKEIFSEPLSQFQPMDANQKSIHHGHSEVDGHDQTSPGVEDARGANRVVAKTHEKKR